MTESAERTDGGATATLPHPTPDDRARPDWVPADQRVLGFDRRTIWPGVVLLVVWVLWAHGMPWLDEQIAVDNPIVAGDVINLGDGEITFVPAVGWELESGTLLVEGEESAASVPTSAELSNEGVAYRASSGGWDGTAEALGDQMIEINEGLDALLAKDEQGRATIENADGVPGQVVYVVGVDQAALIATFVFDGVGVEIEIRGTPESLGDQVEQIAAMIDSTTYRPDGQEASA